MIFCCRFIYNLLAIYDLRFTRIHKRTAKLVHFVILRKENKTECYNSVPFS